MKATILTPTEDMICRYKCQGLQRKEIADKLQRSENTLLVHFRNIHSKIHVNNEVELVIWYIENVLNINIRKLVQVAILLGILIPSIVFDETSLVRAQRSARASRSLRSRRGEEECETDYILTL